MTVRLENLSVSFRAVQALEDVSAEAQAGRIIAVIGPNASGKTTLLRACIGAVRPSAGCVWIGDEKAHRMTAGAVARRVAYVAQRPLVSASFTVRQVIELGRYALPLEPARIDRVIEQFDLAEIVPRRVPELSVGQQQRVTVARAFAQLEPGGILILDEPTSAMDLRYASTVYSAVRDAASRGAAVILALHDLTITTALADDLWVLCDGHLVASGRVADVLQPNLLRDVFETEFEPVEIDGKTIFFADPASGRIE